MSKPVVRSTRRCCDHRVNRPEVRNDIDLPTAITIERALDRFEDDHEVSVGILTGAEGTFCAGMDLNALSATGQRPITEHRGGFGIFRRPPQKPLIAAVERSALGGGLEVALACDLIAAAEDARLGLPEVRRGLVPAAGGLIRLPRRIVGQSLNLSFEEAFEYQTPFVQTVRDSEDAREGAQSFVEKRRPLWQGR
jgi:enoyl-CoA hydratase/carnithine racemase